jgi:asparaginyl-tRNA synthetase
MQYDSVPQSGFVMGLERLIQWICKLDHIREASAFPSVLKVDQNPSQALVK